VSLNKFCCSNSTQARFTSDGSNPIVASVLQMRLSYVSTMLNLYATDDLLAQSIILLNFCSTCILLTVRGVPEGVQTAQTSWASLKDGPQFFLYPVVIVSPIKNSIAF
jgi:hypothetical protein